MRMRMSSPKPSERLQEVGLKPEIHARFDLEGPNTSNVFSARRLDIRTEKGYRDL